MLANYILRAQLTAKSVVRKTVFGGVGGILALIGAVFLAAAGWLWLAEAYGALSANLIVGALFILLGVLVIGYSRVPPRVIPRQQAAAMADPTVATPVAGATPTVLTTASIAQAFILGLTAARTLRRRD